MNMFVIADDVAISANTKLNSEQLNSEPSSGKIPVVVASNDDKQEVNIKDSSRGSSHTREDPPSTSDKDDKNAEAAETKFGAERDITSKSEEKEDVLDEAYRKCKGNIPCVEQRMVTMIDRLDAMKSIPIFEGYVTIEKTSEVVPDNDVVADSDVALLSRIDRYLSSHSIRAHIPDTDGDIPVFLGRVLHEKFVDFNLGTLVTKDASEGQ